MKIWLASSGWLNGYQQIGGRWDLEQFEDDKEYALADDDDDGDETPPANLPVPGKFLTLNKYELDLFTWHFHLVIPHLLQGCVWKHSDCCSDHSCFCHLH
ncbi:hypothetical protein EPA93_22730 [Ktedonosporobacter rubrisoli]|uniref:Uncharacterized protein n=1 Tax=Ktedonosporobacter rubrisoli TaxID=2509675 RepID=A0A4P6JTM3_KTERU|nr:hypothetical protein [Ktedonosporobacter rubrisoli]QBD78650.1 hypothetical protein EPA93_22730 [Ktedonosporobacter rubrisoli]